MTKIEETTKSLDQTRQLTCKQVIYTMPRANNSYELLDRSAERHVNFQDGDDDDWDEACGSIGWWIAFFFLV